MRKTMRCGSWVSLNQCPCGFVEDWSGCTNPIFIMVPDSKVCPECGNRNMSRAVMRRWYLRSWFDRLLGRDGRIVNYERWRECGVATAQDFTNPNGPKPVATPILPIPGPPPLRTQAVEVAGYCIGGLLAVALFTAFVASEVGCSRVDAPPAACPVQQQQKNTCPPGGCPGRWEKDGSYRVDGEKKLDFDTRKPPVPQTQHRTGFIPIPEDEFPAKAENPHWPGLLNPNGSCNVPGCTKHKAK